MSLTPSTHPGTPTPPPRALTVFCGSALGNSPAFVRATEQLGTAIAEHGLRLVYGGGKSGLMGTVALSCLRAGGSVHGVIPRAFLARGERPRSSQIPPELDSAGLPEVIDSSSKEAKEGWKHIQTPVESMHRRKRLMADLCEGFVVLPGGFGTLEELAEMCTWTQLGIHKKPVVLLNINNFFTPLRNFTESAIAAGFINESNRAFLTFVDAPADSAAAEEFNWGEAALKAVKDWLESGAGGGVPYALEWREEPEESARLGEGLSVGQS